MIMVRQQIKSNTRQTKSKPDLALTICAANWDSVPLGHRLLYNERMESRSKKILIGTALGCGGLLLLFVSSCAGFFFWLNQPGELLDPVALLGQDTTGYVEWTLSLDDPGTRDFVEELLSFWRGVNDQRDELVPDVLQPLMRFNDKRNERQVLELFPLLAAWTLHHEETAAQTERHLLTISVENFGNRLKFVDWFLGMISSRSEELQATRYEGEKIYHLMDTDDPVDVIAFIRAPDIFFVSDTGTAQQAIDRLNHQDDRSLGRMPTEFEGVFATLPMDQPLRGVISNGKQELAQIVQDVLPLIDRQLPGGLIDATRFLSLACAFVNSKDFACRFETIWAGSPPDGTYPDGTYIEGVGAALDATFSELGLTAPHSARALPDRMVLDLTIERVTELLRLLPDSSHIQIDDGHQN
jgi:hypothetical protein